MDTAKRVPLQTSMMKVEIATFTLVLTQHYVDEGRPVSPASRDLEGIMTGCIVFKETWANLARTQERESAKLGSTYLALPLLQRSSHNSDFIQQPHTISILTRNNKLRASMNVTPISRREDRILRGRSYNNPEDQNEDTVGSTEKDNIELLDKYTGERTESGVFKSVWSDARIMLWNSMIPMTTPEVMTHASNTMGLVDSSKVKYPVTQWRRHISLGTWKIGPLLTVEAGFIQPSVVTATYEMPEDFTIQDMRAQIPDMMGGSMIDETRAPSFKSESSNGKEWFQGRFTGTGTTNATSQRSRLPRIPYAY
ncbi:hypothetical protein DFJ73DRAFT_763213 [Zopfochytrium polystomum]|nr:hypothetical protein DFJ73DRAFT_763213 [Zopfochytrium polystomum]